MCISLCFHKTTCQWVWMPVVCEVVATIHKDLHVNILNTLTYLYHSYRVSAPIVLVVSKWHVVLAVSVKMISNMIGDGKSQIETMSIIIKIF